MKFDLAGSLSPQPKPARRRAIRINRSDHFIADTHFGHSMMLRFRPFETIEAHDEALIEHWNDVVAVTDIVYHLGDFAFWRMKPIRMQAIFDRLHGRKVLLAGNHDAEATLALGWEAVHHGPLHLITDTGTMVVAQHHPAREWDGWHRGAVHVHGHTHNNLKSSRRSYDVGVDHIGSYPMQWATIADRMTNLPELDFSGVLTENWKPDRGYPGP